MFKNRNEEIDSYYIDAVKDAVINNTDDKKINNKIFLILNSVIAIIFLGGVAFLGYNFFGKDSESSVQKTKVMGVQHTAEDREERPLLQSDIDYAIEIEKLDEPMDMDSEYNRQLSKYLLDKERDKEK